MHKNKRSANAVRALLGPRSWQGSFFDRVQRGGAWIIAALLVCAGAAPAALAAPAVLLDSFAFKPEAGKERVTVFLPRAAAPPVVDGVLDKPAWQAAWRTNRFTTGGGVPGSRATELLAAYDTSNLYLAVRCAVEDPAKLKTKYPAGTNTAAAWGDDCVDLKLSPDDGRTTIQFLVTAAGARYNAHSSGKPFDARWESAARIGTNAYVIEMSIPLAAAGLSGFTPGAPLLFNLGRADRVGALEMSVLAEPYLTLENAPRLVLGSARDYDAFRSQGAVRREVEIGILMDRDQYPEFQRLATGRVRLRSSPSGEKFSAVSAVLLDLAQNGRILRSERIEPIVSPVLDFDLPLEGLAPGAYELVARVADGATVLEAVARREFIIYEAKARTSGRIPITVPASPEERLPLAWPLTFGVPFPWGALESDANVRLLDEGGREIPIQVKVTSRWSKQGSIRWLLIDCLPAPASDPGAARKMTLEYGPQVRRAAGPSATVSVEDSADLVAVATGPIRFVVPKRNTPGIAQLWLDRNADAAFDDKELIVRPGSPAGPRLVDAAGTAYYGTNDPAAEVVVESAGPLKACVRVAGWHVSAAGARLGRYVLRYYAYAGLPYVRVFHTFIVTAGSKEARYRDLAYVLPLSVYRFFLGTPNIYPGTLRSRDESAYLLQRDDLNCQIYQNGAFDDECEKAEGWMTAGSPGAALTVAVKDFWQNYPKELEVRQDRVIVHFWPEHGAEPAGADTNLSVRTVYRNRFAHSGALLDFDVPDNVKKLVLAAAGEQSEESGGLPAANAVGLAKTHELLLYAHAANWETARARTVSRAFQFAPAAVCDPAWVCESKVFGDMLPRAPDRFPEMETALDRTLDNIFRCRELDRDYGMFNFGDAHHNWGWQSRRWQMHRIWRNTHHGWTRWPWLMYARTGRKDILDWAESNARHVADVDHCHYAPKELVNAPYPRGKRVGGICDYKGFVHWASGGRLCYNSIADSLLHHYYFTGNERSRATALEHGRALLDDGAAQIHREGAGRCTSACELYFHTWSNDYLDFIERTMDALLNTQRENGSFPQWEDFAPFLQRYVDLTGSRRGKQAMIRWADAELARRAPTALYAAKLSVLAHAYLYSGDGRYLSRAHARLRKAVDSQYLGEDPRYYGVFIAAPNNLDQSYFMQWMPYYLFAAAKYGREPGPDAPECMWIRTFDRGRHDERDMAAWSNHYAGATAAVYLWQARLKQEREQAFDLAADLRGYKGQKFMARIHPVGAGAPVTALYAFPVNSSAGMFSIPIPADASLEYDLRIYGSDNFSVKAPITAGGMGEVYPIFNGGIVVGDSQPCYFNMPPGTTNCTIGYGGRAWPLLVALRDPSGATVAEDRWIASNDFDTPTRRLGVAVGKRGLEGWSIVVAGSGGGLLQEVIAEPALPGRQFFFALDRAKLFVPRETNNPK